MKLATVFNNTADGALVVVSKDLKRSIDATDIDPTMQSLLESWDGLAPDLHKRYVELNENPNMGNSFDPMTTLAPLPRAWQWLDGSAFETHGELMQKAYNEPPIETDLPLMYQGISNQFLSPAQDVPFPSEDDGIDFEGEFGIITDQVALGSDAKTAANHIRLVVQINDWSLRKIAPIEMKTGFGWVQAKPACSMAGVAITPDELGPAWENCRVKLPLTIKWNDKLFGNANGDQMGFGFDELIAHAARTRNLVAGTIIGSGTVSNSNYKDVGSSCISERRALDVIEFGEIRTPFMSFGDTISMQATLQNGVSAFGAIEQKVVQI